GEVGARGPQAGGVGPGARPGPPPGPVAQAGWGHRLRLVLDVLGDELYLQPSPCPVKGRAPGAISPAWPVPPAALLRPAPAGVMAGVAGRASHRPPPWPRRGNRPRAASSSAAGQRSRPAPVWFAAGAAAASPPGAC